MLNAKPAWPAQSLQFGLFFFAFYGYSGVFTPYASLYFANKGMGVAQVGMLMSLMQIMRIFGPNAWGWLADATRQRLWVLRGTSLASAICLCGLFPAQSFTALFVVMLLINTFTSPQAPLSEALMLAEMCGDLSFYGKLRMWGSIGFIVAIFISGQLLDRYGITQMPWIALALLLVLWLSSMAMRQHQQDEIKANTVSVMSLLRKPEVALFFTSAFLMVAAHAALYVFYSLYLAHLGYSKGMIGFMWILGVLAEIVFFYFQSAIFRRWTVRHVMLSSFLIAILRFALIGWGGFSVALLLAVQVLHAFTFGAHHSSSVMTMQKWFGGALQARGQALYISISYGLGGTVGGLLMTTASEVWGLAAVFYCASLFACGGLLAAFLSFRRQVGK